MTREGDLAEGDPDAPHRQISLEERMLSSGPPRPGIGVGSKGTVGLRLPWADSDAVFGDPNASSNFLGEILLSNDPHNAANGVEHPPQEEILGIQLLSTSKQQTKGRAWQERIQSTRILHGFAIGNRLSTGSLSGHQANPTSMSRSTAPQLHKRSRHHRLGCCSFEQIHAQMIKTATN